MKKKIILAGSTQKDS